MTASKVARACRWARSCCTVLMMAAAAACSADDQPADNTGGSGGSAAGDAGTEDSGGGTSGTGGTGGTSGMGGTSGTGGTGASGGTGGADPTLCGNGTVDTGEECDDGNAITGDGCESDCSFTCVPGPGASVCSDFQLCNGPEVCGADHTCGPGTPLPNGALCGVDKTCFNGTCVDIPGVCGDGVLLSASEECDDGNLRSGDGCEEDCRTTCLSTDPSRDCSDPCVIGAACDATTNICLPGTPAPDGQSCATQTQPALVCRGGACASPLCGNGAPDTGEECDDANLTAGDGCENNCTFTCLAADGSRNCRLSDPCQGTSTCSSTTHTCSTPTPLDDGTQCGPPGLNRICISGVCKRPVCGNGVLEPTEQCDAGAQNGQTGSGCTSACQYQCASDTACSDASACNGTEVCATVTGGKTCQPDTPPPAGTVCGTSPHSICRSETCQVSTCGDGYVDSGATPAEQCEPPNTATCSDTCQNIP